MTTDQFDTECIAGLLNERYEVKAVRGDRIALRVEASTLNAVEWLRNQGIDATPRTGAGWTIQIHHG